MTFFSLLLIHQCTHSLTHSLTNSLTQSLTQSLTHSLTHSINQIIILGFQELFIAVLLIFKLYLLQKGITTVRSSPNIMHIKHQSDFCLDPPLLLQVRFIVKTNSPMKTVLCRVKNSFPADLTLKC